MTSVLACHERFEQEGALNHAHGSEITEIEARSRLRHSGSGENLGSVGSRLCLHTFFSAAPRFFEVAATTVRFALKDLLWTQIWEALRVRASLFFSRKYLKPSVQ